MFRIVFPGASVYREFTLTLAFQLQNGATLGRRVFELGPLLLRLALGPRLLRSENKPRFKF